MLASSTSDKLYLASAEMSGTGRLHRLDIAEATPGYDGELVSAARRSRLRPPGHGRQRGPQHRQAVRARFPDAGSSVTSRRSRTATRSSRHRCCWRSPRRSHGRTRQVESIPISGTDLALPMSLVYLAAHPADFDADGDVDADDLMAFESCASGPGIVRSVRLRGQGLRRGQRRRPVRLRHLPALPERIGRAGGAELRGVKELAALCGPERQSFRFGPAKTCTGSELQ